MRDDEEGLCGTVMREERRIQKMGGDPVNTSDFHQLPKGSVNINIICEE